jgi:hypothetical protein
MTTTMGLVSASPGISAVILQSMTSELLLFGNFAKLNTSSGASHVSGVWGSSGIWFGQNANILRACDFVVISSRWLSIHKHVYVP